MEFDSPVRADSSTFKLYDSMSLASAGTKLPDSSEIMSPGTSSIDGIEFHFPSLRTLALDDESFFSASSDF